MGDEDCRAIAAAIAAMVRMKPHHGPQWSEDYYDILDGNRQPDAHRITARMPGDVVFRHHRRPPTAARDAPRAKDRVIGRRQ